MRTAAARWGGEQVQVTPLTGDASPRTYYRAARIAPAADAAATIILELLKQDELGDQFITAERNRCGRIRAHATRVRPGVALANALVVLRQRQRNSSRAVTQCEQ